MSDADLAPQQESEEPRDDLGEAAADPQAEVEQLSDEVLQANDRLLRAQAELDNFRKRARREIDDARRFAAFPLIADLLPVLDNLNRAIESAEQTNTANGLLEGVRMVAHQLSTTLEQHECRPIDAVGKPFDPNLHESIGTEPTAEHPVGTVTRVVLTGYQLHDRVVRPSQVLIAAEPAADAADPE